jgi:hypothetical protein
MSALPPCAIPVRADDSAILHILKAYIETLKAENDSLKRQLADAEKRVARETGQVHLAGHGRGDIRAKP